MVLVLMTITHVYFAIRPEKRWQARSMFKGWITREEYVEYHDPERWAPPGVESEQVEPSEPQPTVGQDA